MLDNWTTDELFEAFYQDGLDYTARNIGRVAITDDYEIECLWDQYTEARTELVNKYINWCKENDVNP